MDQFGTNLPSSFVEYQFIQQDAIETHLYIAKSFLSKQKNSSTFRFETKINKRLQILLYCWIIPTENSRKSHFNLTNYDNANVSH